MSSEEVRAVLSTVTLVVTMFLILMVTLFATLGILDKLTEDDTSRPLIRWSFALTVMVSATISMLVLLIYSTFDLLAVYIGGAAYLLFGSSHTTTWIQQRFKIVRR